MTAALVDFEKEAMTVSTNKKNSPDRRSPFKVLTTADNSMPMNVNLNHDLYDRLLVIEKGRCKDINMNSSIG